MNRRQIVQIFNQLTGIRLDKSGFSIGFNCTGKRLAISKKMVSNHYSVGFYSTQIEIKNHARPNRNNSNIHA